MYSSIHSKHSIKLARYNFIDANLLALAQDDTVILISLGLGSLPLLSWNLNYMQWPKDVGIAFIMRMNLIVK